MTTEEKKAITSAFIAAIIALLIGCLYYWLCFKYWPKTSPPQQSEVIKVRIDTLKVHDKVFVERWHKAIVKTDSVVKLVYFSAPDTCTTYINEVVVAYQNERDSVSVVVNSKDSIISQYSLLSRSDSTTIEQLNDSIASHKCKRTKSWLKGFAVGFGSGVVISKSVEIINKLK